MPSNIFQRTCSLEARSDGLSHNKCTAGITIPKSAAEHGKPTRNRATRVLPDERRPPDRPMWNWTVGSIQPSNGSRRWDTFVWHIWDCALGRVLNARIWWRRPATASRSRVMGTLEKRRDFITRCKRNSRAIWKRRGVAVEAKQQRGWNRFTASPPELTAPP